MAIFGWFVLSLVFVDEILAIAAFANWGGQHGGFWMLLLCTVVAGAVWWLLASPGARLGDRFITPIVKVVFFAVATIALWATGHETLATWFLVFSVVVNALAQLPAIRVLTTD